MSEAVIKSAAPGLPALFTPARRRALLVTLTLGALSGALYLALFQHADLLTALAAETRQGHPLYALAPIGIALLFSLVHGAFTAHFWDLLGLKAKGH